MDTFQPAPMPEGDRERIAAEKETLRQLRVISCSMPNDTDPEPILQFFAYEHLPPSLQRISTPFGILAKTLVEDLPRNPERTVALRKLLEAKDCAIRAHIYRP